MWIYSIYYDFWEEKKAWKHYLDIIEHNILYLILK